MNLTPGPRQAPQKKRRAVEKGEEQEIVYQTATDSASVLIAGTGSRVHCGNCSQKKPAYNGHPVTRRGGRMRNRAKPFTFTPSDVAIVGISEQGWRALSFQHLPSGPCALLSQGPAFVYTKIFV
ncbi:hypothetical protein NDU88_000590 [Pleurodeles waltl]|uniref:Uncharacterized protein n=1 Tax=Pleurodeles waltl TaxID=8319 RepID=A0AAV7LV99_PLEWA|nr:hypothetical protein NDU88_000590 [Pleurodeles waltl]